MDQPADRTAGFRRGTRDAIGVPVVMLAASFLGFGSLVRSSDLSIWLGLASTATGWALPGQVMLVELYATGASLVVITAGVALANVRLLPLTLSLVPHLDRSRARGWQLYLSAHLIAVTGWVQSMRIFPTLEPADRLGYMVGFSGMLFATTLAATAAGYWLADAVPTEVSMGLVALNPLYFMLLLSPSLAVRPHALALVFGGVAGPLLHLVSPDWGLLLAGGIGGTLAFLLGGRGRKETAPDV